MDLKFYTKCGVGEQYLKDCPIMLENILSKNNLNQLSGFPNNDDEIKHKQMIQLNIRTCRLLHEKGTKNGTDNA